MDSGGLLVLVVIVVVVTSSRFVGCDGPDVEIQNVPNSIVSKANKLPLSVFVNNCTCTAQGSPSTRFEW